MILPDSITIINLIAVYLTQKSLSMILEFLNSRALKNIHSERMDAYTVLLLYSISIDSFPFKNDKAFFQLDVKCQLALGVF